MGGFQVLMLKTTLIPTCKFMQETFSLNLFGQKTFELTRLLKKFANNRGYRLGERQINSLAKILEFSEDETLVEEKQQLLKKECMDAWKVEIKARSGPSNANADALSRFLLKNDTGKCGRWNVRCNEICVVRWLKYVPGTAWLRNVTNTIQNVHQMEQCMKSIHDWNAVILGADSRNGTSATFFLGN